VNRQSNNNEPEELEPADLEKGRVVGQARYVQAGGPEVNRRTCDSEGKREAAGEQGVKRRPARTKAPAVRCRCEIEDYWFTFQT
jgi:hypothetical protein